MSVTAVQRLAEGVGTKVVPARGDYDDASEKWSEAEYRPTLHGTRSLAGYWTGEPGWVAIDEWPYNEVCVILDGRVAIEDADGERVEFGEGEAFLVPAGFRGTWHTLRPTRKVFVGIQPDATP